MIRLNSYKDKIERDITNYRLVDTTRQNLIGRCCIKNNKITNCNEIWSLMIATQFRRKGYATLMLKRIIAKYKSMRLPLVLYVYKDNDIAIKLYEKLGFKITQEQTCTICKMERKYGGQ